MTVKGLVDFVIGNTSGGNTSASLDTFVALYNFFLNNTTSLGIVPVANNFGLSGSGFSFLNGPTPPGNNAWACFKYANATMPFYVLIQAATGTNLPLGLAPGNPGMLWGNNTVGMAGNASQGGLGISFALRADGLSPWNGTTTLNGNDIKGLPVWVSGSSQLYVWPRSNGISGTHQSLCQNLIPLVFQNNVLKDQYRFQIIGDQNNFVFLQKGNSNVAYEGLFFGQVVMEPSRQIQYPTSAYVCVSRTYPDTQDPPFSPAFLASGITFTAPKFVYGSLTGDQLFEGGVMMPSASDGVKICMLDAPQNMFNFTGYFPNTCFASSTWDLISPLVAAYEYPNSYGTIGKINFFSFTRDIALNTIETNGTLAVFGGVTTAGQAKIVTPWSGTTPPGVGFSRSGTQF